MKGMLYIHLAHIMSLVETHFYDLNNLTLDF